MPWVASRMLGEGNLMIEESQGSPAFQHIILALISDRRAVWVRSGLDQSAQSCQALEAHNLFLASFSLLYVSLWYKTGLIFSHVPLTLSEFQWATAEGSIGGLVLGLWRKPL